MKFSEAINSIRTVFSFNGEVAMAKRYASRLGKSEKAAVKMNLKIGLLAGDGIGPEVITEAVKVSESIAKKFNHKISWTEGLVGAAAFGLVGFLGWLWVFVLGLVVDGGFWCPCI